MRGVPEGWVTSRLDEVAEVNPWKTSHDLPDAHPVPFVPMAAVAGEAGGIDISGSRPVGKVSTGYTQFSAGDVLLAKITPCMENGKLGVVPALPTPVAFGSTEFFVIRPTGACLPEWILHFLSRREFRRQARTSMQGAAGQLRVPRKWLEAQRIPRPPLPEQRRIVAKIEELFSELDAGVAALERAQGKLERYRASVLKGAVEGRLTEQWRKENPPEETGEYLLKRILAERRKSWEEEQFAAFETKGKRPPAGWREKYKEPEGADTRGLPELPEGWCWGTVEQIGSAHLGKMLSEKTRKGGTYRLPYLRNENVRWFSLDLSDVKEMGFEAPELARFRVDAGDLLICEGGEPGRCSVVRESAAGLMFQKALHRVRPWLPDLSTDFLEYRFGFQVKAGIGMPSYSQTTIKHLTLEKLRRVPVAIPPAEEQRAVADLVSGILREIEGASTILENATKGASTLRQSILKLAFEGRLVPQDPNDEPASVLLERIRASRKAEKPATKRPRKPKSRQGSLDL